MPEKGILISEYPFYSSDESFPTLLSRGIKPRPVESQTVNAVPENEILKTLAFIREWVE
jgi:hypothetical protein